MAVVPQRVDHGIFAICVGAPNIGPCYQAVVLPSWFDGVAGSVLRTFAHYKGQASTRTKDRYKSQINDENSHI